jgi:hypothetical protein
MVGILLELSCRNKNVGDLEIFGGNSTYPLHRMIS